MDVSNVIYTHPMSAKPNDFGKGWKGDLAFETHFGSKLPLE